MKNLPLCTCQMLKIKSLILSLTMDDILLAENDKDDVVAS